MGNMKEQGKKRLQRVLMVLVAAGMILASFVAQPAPLKAATSMPVTQILPAPTIGTPDATVSTETSLTAAVTAAPANTQYVIAVSGTIKLTQSLVIPMNKNIALTGGGTLSGAGDFDDITVQNSVSYGNGNGGIVTLAHITLTHETGMLGRGIYAPWDEGRTVTINLLEGSLITGNTLESNDVSRASCGAGVYCDGVINMWGGTISHNTAHSDLTLSESQWSDAGCGGGIALVYVGNGPLSDVVNFNMFGGTISDNTASNQGGGVYLSTFGLNVMYMTGGTIKGNTAGLNGGGICLDLSTSYNVTTGYDMYNVLDMVGGSVSDNSAGANGGGIFNTGGSIVTVEGDALVSGNTAACGGGIYTEGSPGIDTPEANSIYGTSSSYGSAPDKAPYVYHGSTMTLIQGGTITGNTATIAGGGAYNSGIGICYSPWQPGYYLGDLLGTTEISGGTITGNHAPEGGGCYNTGILKVSGGTISGNEATSGGNGGGVYNDASAYNPPPALKAQLAKSDSLYEYITDPNDPDYNGMYNAGQSWDDGNGNTVWGSPNLVPLDYIAHGSLTISDAATVSGNTAQNGGGVYNSQDATTTVKAGAAIKSNSAAADGGGIYTQDYTQLFVEQGATFSGNSAVLAAMRKPADDALYARQVQGTSWTAPLTQGYNNFDINYSGVKLTVKAESGGTADSQTNPALAAGTIQLKATPAAGYSFTGWSVESSATVTLSSASDPAATFTMPYADVTVTAHFAPLSSNPSTQTAPINPPINPPVNPPVKPTPTPTPTPKPTPTPTPKPTPKPASKKHATTTSAHTPKAAHTAASSLPKTGDLLSATGLLAAAITAAFALPLPAFMRRKRVN